MNIALQHVAHYREAYLDVNFIVHCTTNICLNFILIKQWLVLNGFDSCLLVVRWHKRVFYMNRAKSLRLQQKLQKVGGVDAGWAAGFRWIREERHHGWLDPLGCVSLAVK